MATRKTREFECGVVRETVRICLKVTRTAGSKDEERLFVKCDQDDCQYVDDNRLPCKLQLSMFQEEVKERQQRARLRREEAGFRY